MRGRDAWASTEGALLRGSLGVHLWGPEVWGPYFNEQHKCNNIVVFHTAPAPAWCACVCVCMCVCSCKYVWVCVYLFMDRFVLRAGVLQMHDDHSPLLPSPFHSLQIHIICDENLAFTPSDTTKGLTLFRACERARHLWQRGPYPKGACMSLRNFSNSLHLLLRDDDALWWRLPEMTIPIDLWWLAVTISRDDDILWWWCIIIFVCHDAGFLTCRKRISTHWAVMLRWAVKRGGDYTNEMKNNLICTQICFQFSCRFAGEIPQCDWID